MFPIKQMGTFQCVVYMTIFEFALHTCLWSLNKTPLGVRNNAFFSTESINWLILMAEEHSVTIILPTWQENKPREQAELRQT